MESPYRKKLLIVFIVFFTIFVSLGCISAADIKPNNTAADFSCTPDNPSYTSDLHISLDNCSDCKTMPPVNQGLQDKLLISNDLPVVSASEVNQKGTFADLQKEINNAKYGSVLDLNRDYNANGGSTIQLDKDLTIDGHGHTLNCEGICSAFHSTKGNIIIKNLKIINGFSKNDGGAIFIEGYPERCPYILNCTFINSEAHYGGAIANKGERRVYKEDSTGLWLFSINIENCTFISNKAHFAGAVYSLGDLKIRNCTFKSNSADNFGTVGCLSYIDIYDSLFYGNSAKEGYGGAVGQLPTMGENGEYDLNMGERNMHIERCTFCENTAKENGGAIYGDKVRFMNSTFNDNTAGNYGGAIYGNSIQTFFIDDSPVTSYFNKNKASEENGGAIYGDDVDIGDVIFTGNSAKVDGGSIYSTGRTQIDYCLFESNRADGALIHQCYGGAIRAEKNLYIANCKFIKNYSYDYGGAIYADTLTLEGTTYFEDNTAYDNHGGAIYTNKFNHDIRNAVFIGNSAGEDGGAIYINKENWITFTKCAFINNNCKKEGGAFYLDSKDAHLSLINDIFIGNNANEGEAAYNCGVYKEITNNYWGSKNPSTDNDVLIEWKPLFIPNIHHVDSSPLKMDLVLNNYSCVNNDTIRATLCFYKSNGELFTGEIYNDDVSFSFDSNIIVMNKECGKNNVSLDLIPIKGGIYTISTDLYGKSVSKTFNVFQVDITAPKITTYYDVPCEFKVHLDGDKEYISNQKVTVSMDSVDYEIFTNDYGDASLYLNNYALYPGTYNISVKAHNIYYQSAITILPNITIVAPKVSSYFNVPVEFKVHLDGDNRFTINQKVKITLNSIEYEVYTDENGNAGIWLNDFPMCSGLCPISINALNINEQSELNIMSTIESSDIVRTYGDDNPFNATFKNSNGEYLPEYSVVEYAFDNCYFDYRNVGDEGQFLLNIAFLNPGYHVITLHNLETDEYNQFRITILPK